MAKIGLIEEFHAVHGSNPHEHIFKIEIVLEGKVDPKTGFVEGMDHYLVIARIKELIAPIEGRNLKETLEQSGLTSSSNESIAMYFLNQLKHKFPVKYVQVWENENRYAVVYVEEI